MTKRLSPERIAYLRAECVLPPSRELFEHIDAIEAELVTARKWADKWKEMSDKHLKDFGDTCVELAEAKAEIARLEQHVYELAGGKEKL